MVFRLSPLQLVEDRLPTWAEIVGSEPGIARMEGERIAAELHLLAGTHPIFEIPDDWPAAAVRWLAAGTADADLPDAARRFFHGLLTQRDETGRPLFADGTRLSTRIAATGDKSV